MSAGNFREKAGRRREGVRGAGGGKGCKAVMFCFMSLPFFSRCVAKHRPNGWTRRYTLRHPWERTESRPRLGVTLAHRVTAQNRAPYKRVKKQQRTKNPESHKDTARVKKSKWTYQTNP